MTTPDDTTGKRANDMSDVKVKQLQWSGLGNEYRYKSSLFREAEAVSVVGRYIVRHKRPAPEPDRGYPALHYEPRFELAGETHGDNFVTLEEAQAAAQSDYETRILSALVSTP